MSSHSLYSIVSFMLMMAIVLPETEHTSSEKSKKNDTQKYCGQELPAALKMICHGTYNSRFKKDDEVSEKDVSEETKYDYDSFPYESPERARTMLKSSRVSEECCIKGCTRDELRSYCATR